MSEEYAEIGWCPHCRKDTTHDVTDSGHERDSSGNYRSCRACGSGQDGWGRWHDPDRNKIKTTYGDKE